MKLVLYKKTLGLFIMYFASSHKIILKDNIVHTLYNCYDLNCTYIVLFLSI